MEAVRTSNRPHAPDMLNALAPYVVTLLDAKMANYYLVYEVRNADRQSKGGGMTFAWTAQSPRPTYAVYGTRAYQRPRSASRWASPRTCVISKARRIDLPMRKPSGGKPAKKLEPTRTYSAAALAEVGNRECRWPVGDPDSPDFHFCRRKVGVMDVYCAKHRALAYKPVPAKSKKGLAGFQIK